MPRFDWRNREGPRPDRSRETGDFGPMDDPKDYGYDPRQRAGYRAEDDIARRTDDYGQADHAGDRDYGPADGRPSRLLSEDDREYARRMDEGGYRPDRTPAGPRSWADRAGDFLSGRHEPGRHESSDSRTRRGPSDRVLWTVIIQRLEEERRLDLSDLEMIVEDAEVTLNGTVRRKEDKRRIEDIADIDGVRHVQNNLRVRDRGHWAII